MGNLQVASYLPRAMDSLKKTANAMEKENQGEGCGQAGVSECHRCRQEDFKIVPTTTCGNNSVLSCWLRPSRFDETY